MRPSAADIGSPLLRRVAETRERDRGGLADGGVSNQTTNSVSRLACSVGSERARREFD